MLVKVVPTQDRRLVALPRWNLAGCTNIKSLPHLRNAAMPLRLTALAADVPADAQSSEPGATVSSGRPTSAASRPASASRGVLGWWSPTLTSTVVRKLRLQPWNPVREYDEHSDAVVVVGPQRVRGTTEAAPPSRHGNASGISSWDNHGDGGDGGGVGSSPRSRQVGGDGDADGRSTRDLRVPFLEEVLDTVRSLDAKGLPRRNTRSSSGQASVGGSTPRVASRDTAHVCIELVQPPQGDSVTDAGMELLLDEALTRAKCVRHDLSPDVLCALPTVADVVPAFLCTRVCARHICLVVPASLALCRSLAVTSLCYPVHGDCAVTGTWCWCARRTILSTLRCQMQATRMGLPCEPTSRASPVLPMPSVCPQPRWQRWMPVDAVVYRLRWLHPLMLVASRCSHVGCMMAWHIKQSFHHHLPRVVALPFLPMVLPVVESPCQRRRANLLADPLVRRRGYLQVHEPCETRCQSTCFAAAHTVVYLPCGVAAHRCCGRLHWRGCAGTLRCAVQAWTP